MLSKVRFVSLHNPEISFEVSAEHFTIGRASGCDITLDDPHISRRQAEVYHSEKGLEIVNLGRNPITVNDQPVQNAVLKNKDVLGFSSLRFVVHIESPNLQTDKDICDEETVMLSGLPQEDVGPRLVGSDANGGKVDFSLQKDSILVGRGKEADLRLSDEAVSRKHFIIERLNKGYFLHIISDANPLYINGEETKKAKLCNGDRLTLGNTCLTFLSERPEDARPVPEAPVHSSLASLKWGALALGILLVSFLAQRYIVSPYLEAVRVQKAAAHLQEGRADEAYSALDALLESGLSAEAEAEALGYMADAVKSVSEKLIKSDLRSAESFLVDYLRKYGALASAAPAWDILDKVRLSIGRRYYDDGDYRSAVAEFASIREDGPYFYKSRQYIASAWRTVQETERLRMQKKMDLEGMLQDARKHFLANRFLTPPDRSAYNAYRAVLALDPGNEQAYLGIQQIKDMYRKKGNKEYEAGNCSLAKKHYNKLLLIEPGDTQALEHIESCRQKRVKRKPTKRQKQELAEGNVREKRNKDVLQRQEKMNKEDIMKLLDKSGTESKKVMKYLFGDSNMKQEEDSPW
jgi:pSer/pThr/pTyr-binding forkhead associated (FHA) protein